jgi:hypothetical protein
MILAIQGTKSFNDYSIFLRSMGTAMSLMEKGDNQILIYSAGPQIVNQMGLEFSNVSERGLKARGIKIRFLKVPSSWIRENIQDVSYFSFFATPGEPLSDLVELGDKTDGVEVGVYRY